MGLGGRGFSPGVSGPQEEGLLAPEERMATPKHRTAPGSSYFVTTKCWQGRAVFQVPEIAEILVQTILNHRERGTYLLHEFVVMPNHLHILLTPSATTNLEKAVQFIKGGSSHAIHKEHGRRMEIWQEDFHDWTVRDDDDWRSKVEYIRLNPVRAHLVANAEEWAYSSASGRFVLDPSPARYSQTASGAKAQFAPYETPGLKPRPPEILSSSRNAPNLDNGSDASGAEAPTIPALLTPGLKSRPPENHPPTGTPEPQPRPTAALPLPTATAEVESRPPEERSA
jgi:putative transposase